jgi:hypothetical protein
VAAVDPVVAGAELKPRQGGVSGDGIDRSGQAIEVDAVDDAGDVHGELLEIGYRAGGPVREPPENSTIGRTILDSTTDRAILST